jgi:hypothetical protein
VEAAEYSRVEGEESEEAWGDDEGPGGGVGLGGLLI